jgi:hypothetical protein
VRRRNSDVLPSSIAVHAKFEDPASLEAEGKSKGTTEEFTAVSAQGKEEHSV